MALSAYAKTPDFISDPFFTRGVTAANYTITLGDVLVGGISEQAELRAVGPQDSRIGTNLVDALGGVLEEIDEVLGEIRGFERQSRKLLNSRRRKHAARA